MTLIAYIGLGSNLEDPPAQLRRAQRALAGLPGIDALRSSSFYRTPPMGPPDQPDYVNAVAECRTGLEPEALLDALQAIEQAQGRVRDGVRWGPRTLDLDLLAMGDLRIETPRLRLPHPGIAERAFVLVPWAELAPDWVVPGLGRIRDLLSRVDVSGIERLEEDSLPE